MRMDVNLVDKKVEPYFPVDFPEEEELVVDDEVVHKASFALKTVKARVDRVNIDGLKRTKDDVVMGTVDDLFKAKDFEDVIVRAQKVRQALDNLGCFRNVCVYIDVSSGPDATPDGLEVTFQVREMSRVVGGVNTTVGEDEGNVVIGLKLPNIWGRGERAQAAYSLGYRNTCSFNITVTKPLPLKPLQPILSASLYQQNQEYPWSGYRLLDRGIQFNVGFKTSPTIKHKLQWEGLIRDMTTVNKTTFAVRESSGPHLKSTLRHTINVDHRDEEIFPTHGVWMQISNEVAGIGGNVANLKSEMHLQANHTLSQDFGVVLQATGALGILHDIYGSTLPDHFFLGGPTTLRGFQQRGVGPHMDGQAVGGRVYWASGLHLYSPLPLPGAQEGLFKLVKSHLFLNAGCLAFPDYILYLKAENMGNLVNRIADCLRHGVDDPSETEPLIIEREPRIPFTERSEFTLSSLLPLIDVRVACGAGVCVRIGRAARLEINYVVPLKMQSRDIHVEGLQFGVGANFL